MSDPDAAKRLGLNESTIYRWRERRRTGEDIGVPRGDPRRVLTSALEEMRSDKKESGKSLAGPDPSWREILDRESRAAEDRAAAIRAAIEAERDAQRGIAIGEEVKL